MVKKKQVPSISSLDCYRELPMRTIAIILTLVVTLVGFLLSYGYTYKKVSGYLYSSPDMQLSVSATSEQQEQ